MPSETDLVRAFFDEARAVAIGDKPDFGTSPRDLLAIASNPSARAEFQRALAQGNDPSLRNIVEQYLLDLADSRDDTALAADREVELVDRAGMSVAAGLTATGIGTTAAALFTGAAAAILIGPLGVLVGGLVGLVATAAGRHTLKKRSDESKSMARKLRRLIGR